VSAVSEFCCFQAFFFWFFWLRCPVFAEDSNTPTSVLPVKGVLFFLFPSHVPFLIFFRVFVKSGPQFFLTSLVMMLSHHFPPCPFPGLEGALNGDLVALRFSSLR